MQPPLQTGCLRGHKLATECMPRGMFRNPHPEHARTPGVPGFQQPEAGDRRFAPARHPVCPTPMPPRCYHVSISSPAGFAVSFEAAAAALEAIDRMFFEPDGAFVWTGSAAGDAANGGDATAAAWQLDGVLYDRGGRVEYVEVKGNAPPDVLEALWTALGWPATPLTFQLMREGVVLDEPAFRAWLAGE